MERSLYDYIIGFFSVMWVVVLSGLLLAEGVKVEDGIVGCGEGFGPTVDRLPGASVEESAVEEPGSVFEQVESGFDE